MYISAVIKSEQIHTQRIFMAIEIWLNLRDMNKLIAHELRFSVFLFLRLFVRMHGIIS